MFIKRCFLLVLMLFSVLATSYAQSDSLTFRKSIALGTGLGWHNTQEAYEGGGTFITLAYEQIRNERLRFSYGASYMWSNFNPGSDNYHDFNSYSLRAIANYDLLKKGRFSIFGGMGAVWTRARGVYFRFALGNSPWTDVYKTERSLGVIMNAGLRFEPKRGNLGFEFVPVCAHLNFGSTREYFFQFRFFKLLK